MLTNNGVILRAVLCLNISNNPQAQPWSTREQYQLSATLYFKISGINNSNVVINTEILRVVLYLNINSGAIFKLWCIN